MVDLRSAGSCVIVVTSRLSFFNIGVTIADFMLTGTVVVAKEALTTSVRYGAMTCNDFFSSQVGRGSRFECLAGECWMIEHKVV